MSIIRIGAGVEKVGGGWGLCCWVPDFERLEYADAADVDVALHELCDISLRSLRYAAVGRLTLATFASVAASLTTVFCMTLCTVRLNIGSTLFFCPPPEVEDVLAEELRLKSLDFMDELRLNVAACSALPASARTSKASSLDPLRSMTCGVVASDGNTVFGLIDEASIIPADMESLRMDVDTVESVRSRERGSGFTMSCIWRLRGFFELVGGGLTMM